MKRRIKAGTKNAAIVARGLLKQISAGIFRFSTEDIAQNLNISNVSVRNSLRYYLDNDINNVVQSFIEEKDGTYRLTLKGAFYYHYYENFYTLDILIKCGVL